jgi:hypothetical protein
MITRVARAGIVGERRILPVSSHAEAAGVDKLRVRDFDE